MSAEEWRAIPGHEGRYEVSDLGRVRSLLQDPPHIMRQRPDMQGRPQLSLSVNGRQTTEWIHRAVALAFLGPRPTPETEIRHLDDDPTNNALANLAYGTRSDNLVDRVRNGIHHMSKRTHCKRGHPYDEDNTYVRADSRRGPARCCRTCRAETSRRYRANKRAAA